MIDHAGQRWLPSRRYSGTWRREGLAAGRLPQRYAQPWAGRFDELLAPVLRAGITVLDVGSGREPVLPAQTRPDVTYVGMDVSASELAQAPAGAYDETVVDTVANDVAEFHDRFDLIVSYQVFEHVDPLDVALQNIASYLRPGGTLIALFSGRYSPMALINRAMSLRLARRVNQTLVQRDPETMFEANYDRCYASAIRRLTVDWSSVEIEPRWEAASYFDFSRPLLRAYLALESRLERGRWEDLATHYFLRARK